MKQDKKELIKFFDQQAPQRDKWVKRNSYYHKELTNFYQDIVPVRRKVLEIGSSTGNLLSAVKPINGVGVDISKKMVEIAKKKFPKLKFKVSDAENLGLQEEFDYILMSDLIGNLKDIQKALEEANKVSAQGTRIVINYYNFLWEYPLLLLEKLHLKMPQASENWLSENDMLEFLNLAELEVVKKGKFMLIPFNIPLLSLIINKYVAKLPLIRNLCLVQYFVVRKAPNPYIQKDYSVSVIVPARNEEGNIEKIVQRLPNLGNKTEIVFVEGGSKDNTFKEIEKVIEKYKNLRDIKLIPQGNGKGKGDAVRKGFAAATGEILMILDADISVAPEDMSKFYQALRSGKGEFIMGSRLVYPLEDQAMRFLNILGNKFFSLMFSYLLDQKIKDTLCGTKVLFKKDYEEIARNRKYFGDFDPFGDFDLIFGAAKLNLKILEIPVRYYARTYGQTNISRFSHGWLLLKMTLFASRKLKFT